MKDKFFLFFVFITTCSTSQFTYYTIYQNGEMLSINDENHPVVTFKCLINESCVVAGSFTAFGEIGLQ